MDYLQLGFSSLKSLVENIVAIHGLLAVEGDSVKIKSTVTKSSEVVEEVQNFCQKLESEWVRIVTSRRPDLLCFQLENVKLFRFHIVNTFLFSFSKFLNTNNKI